MLYNISMKKCCCSNKKSELNGKENEEKYLRLTKDVEASEEILGEACVETLKNFRKKNADADLSVYKIKVQ